MEMDYMDYRIKDRFRNRPEAGSKSDVARRYAELVYDLKGILLYKQYILPENNLMQINVSKWISGRYFIEVVNEEGIKCVKSFNIN